MNQEKLWLTNTHPPRKIFQRSWTETATVHLCQTQKILPNQRKIISKTKWKNETRKSNGWKELDEKWSTDMLRRNGKTFRGNSTNGRNRTKNNQQTYYHERKDMKRINEPSVIWTEHEEWKLIWMENSTERKEMQQINGKGNSTKLNESIVNPTETA